MTDNYDLIERNEANQNSKGGTEITLKQIYNGTIDRALLEQFQIIPSRIRDLKEDKIRIYFANDLPDDPEAQKFRDQNFRNKFHAFVFNSNWQYQRYQLMHGFPYDEKSIIIEPGIVPAPHESFSKKFEDGFIDICYTSTPQRGLDILVPVFKKLAETDSKIHLHVHSSFKIYGWEEMDAQFQALYDECSNHPQITYHGFTDHEELQEKLQTYHILGYPCTWMETSCRAMLEAMSAGLLCVHPNFGALPETSGALNVMYQGNVDKNKHAQIFYAYLRNAIELLRTGNTKDALRFTKAYVDGRYNMPAILNKWNMLLTGLASQYPTVESRKLASDIVFNFKTS